MGLGPVEDRAWISINSCPYFRDGELKPYAALTSFQNITKQRQDEETISNLNRQYNRVLKAATEVAIITADRIGTITYFNTGAERILGYAADDVVGKSTVRILVSPKELEAAANQFSPAEATPMDGIAALTAAVDKDGSLSWESTFLRKNGTELLVTAVITPIRSDQGDTTGYLAVIRDETDRARLEEVLKHSARTDHLTGLANRMVFEDALDLELKKVQRFKSSSALMLIDVDRFKQVNDTLGHETGDRALQALAQALERQARSTDLVARYGGDEFVMLLVGANHSGAMVAAENIRKAIDEIPANTGDPSLAITVCIGVSALDADDIGWHAAMRRADRAMYRAKSAGRNAVFGSDHEGIESPLSTAAARKQLLSN